jgi:hypothetical protein
VYESADSVTLLIYNSIRGYFDGLTKIASNNLTEYSFDALKKSMTEGTFGTIKIEKEEVNAYAAISKILLKVSTDIYRKNKIVRYIEEANSPLQLLLKKFQAIMQLNIAKELDFTKIAAYTYYQQLLDTTLYKDKLNQYEKAKAIAEYYRQIADINQQKKQVEAFSKSIANVAKGHQVLFDNRNRLTAKEVRELLIEYTSDLQEINTEFNQLKKQ